MIKLIKVTFEKKNRQIFHSREKRENVQDKYTEDGITLKQSNALINAKYKSNLFSQQIAQLAMRRIKSESQSPNSPLVANLYPGEILELYGDNKKSNLAKELKRAATQLVGTVVVLEDNKGNFKVFSMVTNCTYKDGIFRIVFNEEMRMNFLAISTPYTKLNMISMSLLTNYSSFRIYMLLKEEMYKSNENVNGGAVEKTFNLSEFRFMTGLANINEVKVQNEIEKSKNKVDWDYIYEKVVIEKKYKTWGDMERYFLRTASEEIEQKTEIRFEYEPIYGKKNKVVAIHFTIYPNVPTAVYDEEVQKRQAIIERGKSELYRQFDITDVMHEKLVENYLGHNTLQKEDLELLLSRAHGDDDKVIEAIEEADKQPHIYNYMGWIIDYIEGNFSDPIEVVSGSSEKAEKIKELKEEVEKNKPSIQQSAWEKTKSKEDFSEFIESLGIPVEQFEELYDDVSERIDLYIQWKKTK